MFEANMFTLPVNYTLGFEPGAAPDAVATFDQIRSSISGVSPRMDTDSARMFTYAANVSYVTGSHSLKIGTQVRTGWSQELFTMRGDMLQITNNDVPNSVRLVNTPSGHKEEGTNGALYIQDSWRLGRFTLNPGLRYERFGMSIPAQSAPAGTWVAAVAGAAPCRPACTLASIAARNLGTDTHQLVLVRTTRFAEVLPLHGDHAAGRPVAPPLVLEPGRSGSVVTRLAPGNYLLIDNLPWHYWLGTSAAIVVR